MFLLPRRRWLGRERQLHREANRGHGLMGGPIAERRALPLQPRRGELLGDLRASQYADASLGRRRRRGDERGSGR